MTSCCYTACSCNRVPHCADWGTNGLLCFGTRNAVAVYEPRAHIGRVTHTLHRHRDHVNTVHWIKPGDGAPETELLSGSVDGTAVIWSGDGENGFRCTSVLNVGSKVAFADSLWLSAASARLLICAGSISGAVQLWLREGDMDAKHVQTIDFGRKLPLHCRLTRLPNSTCPLLAVALEDASTLLYTARLDAGSQVEPLFVQVQRLVGHEDWVVCMDFAQDGDDNLFLATGSKDSMIRLWRISETVEESSSDELQLERDYFTAGDRQYNVTLESVLRGHEDWVYGVHWQPVKTDDCETMRLLSSSIDKTMIVWEPAEIMNGMWTEAVRVGVVGGNSMGFYGCKFGPDGLHILAHGYQGSFHIWKYSQDVTRWLPRPAPGGHFSQVVDLCWEPKGRFLITASADQTTRIHAPWKGDDLEELWHEIARPQIHGYDMTCLAILAPHTYVSGADEKVVRIFTATSAFRNQLKSLTNVEDFESVKARSAAVPSLGLTNKAMYEENDENSPTGYAYEPPTEEALMQNTLWPETNKLYGHGYEIFCMAARHDGKLLATACKSTTQEHSAILLWATDTWTQVQQLVYHQLTVTQMAFSPDDRYLLSVSRDRRWSLFKTTDGVYELVAASLKQNNPHSRIIWCCAWTQNSGYFATGSRDGKIAIWPISTIENNIAPLLIVDTQNQSVTALCFTSSYTKEGSYLLAIGYETGCIEIRKVNLESKESTQLKLLDTSQAHHLTVRRLMFRPSNHSQDYLQLASCSSDHSVKIHNIELSLLSVS
ncbi:PREDICTED: probable elongator complex protein 2 [Vollenhovia emeryi]|uniref:probable elongator complex protein 2 n=1 Tax=Vollenhovia emeryi TaxID=411798 RepID=UPI0005F42624|nr:PREDICTED: probable elongator complex protein 2 [Vollenhovia emeryi]